jgi:GntR family transcriptional regulator
MLADMALDPRDPLPLYAQLERGIKREIAVGGLAQGSQLPTVRQLAVDLKVNANTVAKVYAELERQRVLTTRRGVGTFVAEPPAGIDAAGRQRSTKLQSLAERFLAEAAGQGFAPQELSSEIQRLCHNS